MRKSRHIGKIIIGMVVAALIFTGTFLIYPQALGIQGAGTNPEYADKLFNKEEISTIAISADADAWAGMLENATAEEFISCDITINGETYQSVGIRPKGNSSLATVAQSEDSDRFSFKIKFDKYVEGQNYYGLKEMVINNMQGDATYMKEYLSYDLFETMGVDAPLYAFSHISLNGEAWGLYLAVETMEESFAERVYGTDYGELYKPESQDMAGGGGGEGAKEIPQGMTLGGIQRSQKSTDESIQLREGVPEGMGKNPQDDGKGSDLVYTDNEADSYSQIFDNAIFKASESDRSKIIEALKALSTGDNLEEYVDTDEVLRYFSVNTALVNLDSYVGSFKHNYYLYEEEGTISILPWDLNLSFAGFQSSSSTDAVNFPIDTPVASGISLEERPLIGRLLENADYKNTYHQYLKEIADEYFNSGVFEEKIDKLDELIRDYVKNDPTAFYTVDEYTKAVETLKSFGRLRGESIQGQIDGSVPSTEEGQTSNPDNLIDASQINLSDMGSQGGRQGTRNKMPELPAV